MKKKVVMISAIAGILVLCLCVKFLVDGRNAEEPEQIAREELTLENTYVDGQKSPEKADDSGQKEEEASKELETTETAEAQEQAVVAERILFEKPVVMLNGYQGELSYRWDYDCIRVDEETLLVSGDCYFEEEMLQQKIFYLAKAPEFELQEVFRQDSRVWDERPTMGSPEFLEWRMSRPKQVENGYVYEVDGKLCRLDEDFQEKALLCDLHQLMGDLYGFSPGTYQICDVTEDASKLIACTDQGLYEYDLVNGQQKLLESAYYAHHEIIDVEDDCECGERDFVFSGPVKTEYAPDGQSYAFLTGTEEADWGDYTGVVLRAGNGETLYQKEIKEYMGDFRWVESESAVSLAFFYRENESMWMDQVDVHTGEISTFSVPDDVFYGADLCVGFLDENCLIYPREQASRKQEREKTDKSEFEVYRLSDGEREELKAGGEADWRTIVLDLGDYDTIAVRYPKL